MKASFIVGLSLFSIEAIFAIAIFLNNVLPTIDSNTLKIAGFLLLNLLMAVLMLIGAVKE